MSEGSAARESIWNLVDFLGLTKPRKPCWHCDGQGGHVHDTWTTIKGVLVPDDEVFTPCHACGGTGLADDEA